MVRGGAAVQQLVAPTLAFVGIRPWPVSDNHSSVLRVDETRLGIRAGVADGYRRRKLTAASTLVPAACGSAGGMPCVPAARGGGRKLLGVATGGGRRLRVRVASKDRRVGVSDGESTREKSLDWFGKPSTKRMTSCGGVRVSLRTSGGGGTFWCQRLGFITINFIKIAIWQIVNIQVTTNGSVLIYP